MTMTPATYANLAMRTAKHFDRPELYFIHAALGLTSDSAELCEVVLQQGTYGSDRHIRAAMVEELGDVLWFLVYATTAHTASLDQTERAYWFSCTLENPSALPVNLAHGKYMLVDSSVLLEVLVQTTAASTVDQHTLALSAACGQYATLVKSQVVYGGNVPAAAYLNALHIIGKTILMAMHSMGISWVDVAAANIAKLQMRYPSTYSDCAALSRADKQQGDVVAAEASDTATLHTIDDVLHAASYSSSAVNVCQAAQAGQEPHCVQHNSNFQEQGQNADATATSAHPSMDTDGGTTD